MIFLRPGPRFLFVRTSSQEEIKEFLETQLKGEVMSFDAAFDKSGDNCTMVFITNVGPIETRVEDAKMIIMIPEKSSIVLANIINGKIWDIVERVDIGPGLLVVKTVNNNNETMLKIKDEYMGIPMTLEDAVTKGELNDTIVAFTSKPIRNINSNEDFFEPMLLVPKPIHQLETDLKKRMIRLTTESLEGDMWCELKVNIFDADGHYEKHLERLSIILADLDGGLILGETWTRDHAVGLLFVDAYQAWVFTMLTPVEFKKLLLGLEYNSEGKRFADFDIYHKKEKIRWGKLYKEIKLTRGEMGNKFREGLFITLSPEAREKLLEIEGEITRLNR